MPDNIFDQELAAQQRSSNVFDREYAATHYTPKPTAAGLAQVARQHNPAFLQALASAEPGTATEAAVARGEQLPVPKEYGLQYAGASMFPTGQVTEQPLGTAPSQAQRAAYFSGQEKAAEPKSLADYVHMVPDLPGGVVGDVGRMLAPSVGSEDQAARTAQLVSYWVPGLGQVMGLSALASTGLNVEDYGAAKTFGDMWDHAKRSAGGAVHDENLWDRFNDALDTATNVRMVYDLAGRHVPVGRESYTDSTGANVSRTTTVGDVVKTTLARGQGLLSEAIRRGDRGQAAAAMEEMGAPASTASAIAGKLADEPMHPAYEEAARDSSELQEMAAHPAASKGVRVAATQMLDQLASHGEPATYEYNGPTARDEDFGTASPADVEAFKGDEAPTRVFADGTRGGVSWREANGLPTDSTIGRPALDTGVGPTGQEPATKPGQGFGPDASANTGAKPEMGAEEVGRAADYAPLRPNPGEAIANRGDAAAANPAGEPAGNAGEPAAAGGPDAVRSAGDSSGAIPAGSESAKSVGEQAVTTEIDPRKTVDDQIAEVRARQAARNQARAGGKQSGAASPPTLDEFADAVRLGRLYMQKGLTRFADWSSQLVSDLGDHVRPYLKELWAAVTGGPGKAAEAMIVHAIGLAEPAREEQLKGYATAKAARLEDYIKRKSIAGEAGMQARRAAFEGSLPTVAIEPVRPKLGQPDVDALYDTINRFPFADSFDELHATEALTALMSGQIPHSADVEQLEKVFPAIGYASRTAAGRLHNWGDAAGAVTRAALLDTAHAALKIAGGAALPVLDELSKLPDPLLGAIGLRLGKGESLARGFSAKDQLASMAGGFWQGVKNAPQYLMQGYSPTIGSEGNFGTGGLNAVGRAVKGLAYGQGGVRLPHLSEAVYQAGHAGSGLIHGMLMNTLTGEGVFRRELAQSADQIAQTMPEPELQQLTGLSGYGGKALRARARTWLRQNPTDLMTLEALNSPTGERMLVAQAARLKAQDSMLLGENKLYDWIKQGREKLTPKAANGVVDPAWKALGQAVSAVSYLALPAAKVGANSAAKLAFDYSPVGVVRGGLMFLHDGLNPAQRTAVNAMIGRGLVGSAIFSSVYWLLANGKVTINHTYTGQTPATRAQAMVNKRQGALGEEWRRVSQVGNLSTTPENVQVGRVGLPSDIFGLPGDVAQVAADYYYAMHGGGGAKQFGGMELGGPMNPAGPVVSAAQKATDFKRAAAEGSGNHM